MEKFIYPFLSGLPQALLTTVLISSAACVLGVLLGIVLLITRTSAWAPFRYLVVIYVSAMRGIPLLIQLLVVYYAIPAMLDISISPIAAGIIAMAMNTSAYISEVLRGVLSSIPVGQRAAAFSLGMNRWQTWQRIILPQIFLRALPPLTNEFTVMFKASSLLSIIAVSELSTLARNVNLQTNAPLEVFTVSAAIYFVMLYTLSTISRRIEHRVKARVGRHD
ncbi:MAG: amino acid ABC transporter permease [Ottowia sp.]|uniref:amino acid ABC transporter permease n=1 Tax=unclassified Ottowia TaxID=2645081 RepID=UPI003C307D6B